MAFRDILHNYTNEELTAFIKTIPSGEYIVLDNPQSHKYYDLVIHFPDDLALREIQPFLQLNFSCENKLIPLEFLNNFLKRRDKYLSLLGNAHAINLSYCGIFNDGAKALKNVTNLNLSGCREITDASALGNVHTLDLAYTCVTDASALGNVYDLDLSYTRVVDVSALGNVHDLKLRGTELPRDIFMYLAGVHSLDLRFCKTGWRYSMEDNQPIAVHNLKISKNHTNMEMFKNVYCLTVDCGGSSIDASSLTGVRSLILVTCRGINFNAPLDNLQMLVMQKSSIYDVSKLSHLHTLDLSFSLQLVDVSPLKNVTCLTLATCPMICDVSSLGNVKTLDLSNCVKIKDVSALGGVHTLNLSCCNSIRDVSALGGVHTLNLTGVTQKNYSLCFTFDEMLKDDYIDVCELGNVTNLDLTYCNIVNVPIVKKWDVSNFTRCRVIG